MKKTYLRPELEAVAIDTEELLDSSVAIIDADAEEDALARILGIDGGINSMLSY